MPMTDDEIQNKIFAAIRSEREYQKMMIGNPNRPDMVELGMPGHLLAMEQILAEARAAWYKDSEQNKYQSTMHHLRKVAGLIFSVGEKYGMPIRESKTDAE